MKSKFKYFLPALLVAILFVGVAALTPINGFFQSNIDAAFHSILNILGYWPREVSVRAFGAKGDGVTDDTVAFQAAIDSLTNNGVGGTIIIPDGRYLINGAFTESTGAKSGITHSQLHLPVRDLTSQTICPITIRGVTDPTLNTVWTVGSLPAVNTNGAIIISTNIPADPSYTIIGGAAPTGASLDLTAVYLKLERLTFRTYDNPQTSPLNLGNIGQAAVRDCTVDTGTSAGNQSQPTHAAVGIVMPKINNWVISEIHNVDVRGYMVGYELNEHSDVDDARVWICVYGWHFPGGTHGIHMGHTVTTGCTYGVIGGPAGFVQRLDWGMYAVEHSILPGGSAWANTVADFTDTNSTLRGIINFAAVDSGVGAVDTFTIINTTNVAFFNANSHCFVSLDIKPTATNDVLNNYLFTGKDFNGAGVFNMGVYLQPFQAFSGLWLGPGSFNDPWQVATNFALLSNGTNSLAINAPQIEGGTAVGSHLDFSVGHVTKLTLSNSTFTVNVPMLHGFLVLSNLVSGQIYNNPWGGPLHVAAVVQVITATVAGNAAMQLRIPGVITNSVGLTTAAGIPAQAGFFTQLVGDVPVGGTFVFTNTSTGANNSVTLFSAELKGD